jgi:hypothetical protein
MAAEPTLRSKLARSIPVVRCSSDDGRRKDCPTSITGDVELMEQRSKFDCIQGSTWDHDSNGIWVDRGCRADFIVEPNER